MSEPKSIGAALGGVSSLGVLRAESLWPEVVGAEAAAHSRPAAFRQGRLTVFCDAPAWAHELTFLGEEIRHRLDELLGGGVVKELRFKSGRRKPAPEASVVPAPEPPRTVDAARLESEMAPSLEKVRDPELRRLILQARLGAARRRDP